MHNQDYDYQGIKICSKSKKHDHHFFPWLPLLNNSHTILKLICANSTFPTLSNAYIYSPSSRM